MDTKLKILAGFIILIIVALITLVFFEKIKYFAAEQTHREICKRQVDINAFSAVMQPVINCPILNITIHGNPDSDANKKRIADTMADARYAYGVAWDRGDIFPAASGTFCALYAIIDFDEKNKEIHDFDKYLLEKPYSLASDKSYYDYLTNDLGGHLPISGRASLPLSTNTKYAVLMWYSKKYSKIDSFLSSVGTFVQGTQYGLPSAGATTTGAMVTVIGGGVVLGAAGLIGGVLIGGGYVIIGGLAATGIVTGSTLTTAGLFLSDNDPVIVPMIILVPYGKPLDLKNIGCEYFPVSLGTRLEEPGTGGMDDA